MNNGFIDNLTPEIELIEDAPVELLPPKSKKIYEKQYEEFSKWCNEKGERKYSETVLLSYFLDKSEQVKASTLWSYYSMLKTMLVIKNKIDISKYTELLAYLKRKNNGYKPLTSNTLTADEVDQFLTEAPDDEFLMIKVALILGIAGACRGDELVNLSMSDVTDLGSSILFTIKKTEITVDRKFIVTNYDGNLVDFVKVCKKYMSLRKIETKHSRFFVQYRNNECTTQPVGKNTFGKMPQRIASFLNLPDASSYTGHCFRRTSASFLASSGVNMHYSKRFKRKSSATVAEGLSKLRTEKVISITTGLQSESSTSTSLEIKNNEENVHLETNSTSDSTVSMDLEPHLGASPSESLNRKSDPVESLTTYCRLCLNQAPKNKIIYLDYQMYEITYPSRTEQFKENKILQTEAFLRMIRTLMPNFDQDLVYNPVMCFDCSTKLQLASDFVEQCMASQKKIQKYKDTYSTSQMMVSCEDVVQNKTRLTQQYSLQELPQCSKKLKTGNHSTNTFTENILPHCKDYLPEIVKVKTENSEELENEEKFKINLDEIFIKQELECNQNEIPINTETVTNDIFIKEEPLDIESTESTALNFNIKQDRIPSNIKHSDSMQQMVTDTSSYYPLPNSGDFNSDKLPVNKPINR